MLAMVYKGGPIVPVLLGLLLMVVVFSFERYAVISKAAGSGNLDQFMTSVQKDIKAGNIEEAMLHVTNKRFCCKSNKISFIEIPRS
jgi:biopolymer transport protein ExbB